MAERILTGIKPTGQLTLGNYIAVLKNLKQQMDRGECFIFIADLHALTLPIDPEVLRQNSIDIADFYLQAGETRYIYISENGTATSIAITLSGQALHCSYYANNLSTSGTMSLSSSSRSSRIRIENRGKSGTKWNIRVKNPTNHDITVHYNCKMCFESDAKNWTALGNNERIVVVEPHKYEDIQISENWFVTHITLSYVSGSTRYITYANELNVNKSIHMYWNTKGA